ncbi:hypothetical protein [Comamonas sp. JC664]
MTTHFQLRRIVLATLAASAMGAGAAYAEVKAAWAMRCPRATRRPLR